WTLFHSYAFDFSVWEIWGALLYGGRLVVVPWEVSRSPERFLDLLAAEQVTVLNQTPSAFAQLTRSDAEAAETERGGTPSLRTVIFGGEALDMGSLAPWFERHGDARPRLVNMYGITETTVHVTWRPIVLADTRERRSAIGVRIPDLGLYVLDASLRPVPIGVPGELVVGGAGLARGYLGRPDLTASRFVPDPAGMAEMGARLYRSGDLGRFRPNGDLEHLGRIDHQVKIRGFRIEPGEVEAIVAARPDVRECAVIAVRREPSGEMFLAAYVVPAAGSGLRESGLREELKKVLPDYMLPSAVCFLDALPLTSNGKLDRKALPALERQISEGTWSAPRTPAEEILAGIWAELLGVSAEDRVGATDSFFDLGGHSLLATRLVAAIRGAFQVDVPLRLVFEHPTVEGMARAILEMGREPGQAGTPEPDQTDQTDLTDLIIALPRAPGENRFPVSFSQLREWILDRLDPGTPNYNIPSPLRIEGPIDLPALAAALQGLVGRHEVFRTRFVAGPEAEGPEPLQAVLPEVTLEMPV